MAQKLPSHARAVIVGGGIMGVGLAYHLAKEGWGGETVLVEKAELTSGSTWHAAGQITQSVSSHSLGRCVAYNLSLYAGGLEAETGQSVTWHGCGSLRLAYTEDEMDWLRHTLSVGRALGFRMEIVSPARAAALHPHYQLDGVLGALHTPDDGHVDPAGATMALAAGARAGGVQIVRRCRATNIVRAPGGEWTVETERGPIRCQHVVNAGGTYARQIGDWSGLQLPAVSMTHHYFVTEPVPEFAGLDRELPVVRDDRKVSGYVRMEQRRGLIGIYEKENPNTVWEDGCPWEAENELFDPDYDRVLPWLEEALRRMPVLADRAIARTVHGAISHPPDGNPLVGPAPGAPGYWYCCGTQIGIGWGPGLTRELARWMVHGAANISMRDCDPRRFGDYATREWQAVKAKEDYCLRHEIPYPHFSRKAGRPVHPSPLYETLKAKGAVYEEVYGFERPRWFARGGVPQRDHDSFRRTPVHDMVGGEVRAVRERAGIMDITAFAKVEVAGPGAAALLGRLSANRVPGKDGATALAHLTSRAGRIELETIILRMEERRYYLVCAAFFERRLVDHLECHAKGLDVEVRALSRDWAALAINGPRAREILAACTDADLGNASFPWMTAQPIAVAGHEVWAMRMSYAGELGWELHMPSAACHGVYDGLWKAGESCGIADYGSFAMNAMRMEKAFKGAAELTNEVTLAEADVLRFAKSDQEFLGRAAALDGSLRWACAYLAIDTDGIADGHGGEAVMMDGKVVGSTSSVAYGHSVETTLAFAYLDPEAAAPNTELRVLVQGKPRCARVLVEPAYDPQSLRPRADAEAS